MSALRELGRRLAEWQPHSELVGPRTFDAVGAFAAGSATAEGLAVAALSRWETGAGAEIVKRVATVRMTELDDIHMPSCTTPGAVVVPTALTLAGAFGADPEAYRRAVEIGYEAMTRLGAAISGPRIVYRGIWPTYFCAPFAAAAVAAAILELDPAATANALGLALTRATGLTSGIAGSPLGRWLTVGDAARSGCAAAFAASDGFIAEVEVDRVARAAGVELDLASLQADASPAIEQVSVKPIPAAKQSLAAVEATLALRGHAEPRSIRIRVPDAYTEMVGAMPTTGSRLGRLSSARWNIALAILAPEELEDVERARAEDPELSGLAAGIEVVADPGLSRMYPDRWPAKVDFGNQSETVLETAGDPARGNGLAAIDTKWDNRPEQLATLREAALALDLARLATLLDTFGERR